MQRSDSLLYLRQPEVCHGVDGVQHAGCLLEVTLSHMMLRSLHRLDVGVADIRTRGCGEGTDSVAVQIIAADTVFFSFELILMEKCASRLCSGRVSGTFPFLAST